MASIRETILSYPGIADCEDYLDKVILKNRKLQGGDEYDPARHQSVVNLCAADAYAMIGGLPDFSENKLSMTYPRSWYFQTAKRLYAQNGEPWKATLLGRRIVITGTATSRW